MRFFISIVAVAVLSITVVTVRDPGGTLFKNSIVYEL